MKIRKIKITNFKSVLETEFNTPKDLTALVGGNESGKSNLLKSLIGYFSSEAFSQSDKHQLGLDDPEVTIDFSLTDEEKKKISDLTGMKKVDLLTVSKKGAEKTIVNLEIPTSNPAPVVTASDDSKKEDPEPSQEAESSKDDIPADESKEAAEKVKPETLNENPTPDIDIKKEILSMLPTLVSVESVVDLVDGTDIKIEDLKSAKEQPTGLLSTINAFLQLGQVDLDQLLSPDISLSEKNKILLSGSAKAGKKIREYWTQEDLKIHIGTNGESLAIHVRDGGCLPNKPVVKQNMKLEDVDIANQNIENREDDTKWIWTGFGERSFGFRWFVTFYSKYLSVVSESDNIIIVIDDLGIYLNASIQEVLYKKLLNLTKDKVQIIYTTHSPYMLDFSETENILLVEKKETGTKVLEDWWKRKSFRELPQPLREIGVSRAEHIFKQKNLLVEGATDITVIRRLAKMFTLDTEVVNNLESINIYPVGGKGEMIGVAMYCRTDGKKAITLFDSETEALALNQRAKGFNIASGDVSTLASPYDTTTFKIETIEDLVPDKLIVNGLNKIGKQLIGDTWVDFGNIHRKSGETIYGIMEAIKKRLEKLVEEEQMTTEQMESILSSKKAILAEALETVKIEEYTNERKTAVENAFKNLSALIKSA